MDTIAEATELLIDSTRKAAYSRALLDAYNAVAGLMDGDSPIHDSAIVDACKAIQSLSLPR